MSGEQKFPLSDVTSAKQIMETPLLGNGLSGVIGIFCSAKGITHSTLAREAGIDKSRFKLLMNGQRQFTPDEQTKVSTAMDRLHPTQSTPR